ncbi:hypothetical protein HDV05_003820 [Chytridiales sp. JEL 0842]|nr:hypothetical protein HDV05_003820 [Chytridiales sp. JEL 0842]
MMVDNMRDEVADGLGSNGGIMSASASILTEAEATAWKWVPPPAPLLKRKHCDDDDEDDDEDSADQDNHHNKPHSDDEEDALGHLKSKDVETGQHIHGRRFKKYYRLTEGDIEILKEDALRQGKQLEIRCTLSHACSLQTFAHIADYENHYQTLHNNVCSQCKRTLPTARLLHLHIQEIHDSYFQSQAEKGNVYECFVEGCQRKCSGPFKRKLHMIDSHEFPKDFDFDVILGTGKSRNGKSKRAKSPTKQVMPPQPAVKEPTSPPTADLDALSSSMLAMKLVPRSVRVSKANKPAAASPTKHVSHKAVPFATSQLASALPSPSIVSAHRETPEVDNSSMNIDSIPPLHHQPPSHDPKTVHKVNRDPTTIWSFEKVKRVHRERIPAHAKKAQQDWIKEAKQRASLSKMAVDK